MEEVRKLFESVAKVMKCSEKKCKKYVKKLEAEKKENVDPKKKKLSSNVKNLNNCLAEKCERENRENFKVLHSYHKKDCQERKDPKACKLAKVSESYAKKIKYSGKDFINYKKLEMS